MTICIAGCGALGSNVAMMLGLPCTLIDNDVVDENNVASGTTVYSREHIGMPKVEVLAGLLYYKYDVEATCINRRVSNNRIYNDYTLVIDCFDNRAARTTTVGYNTIHLGVSPQFVGAVVWDERYTLPTEDEDNVVCTHQVGRHVIHLTSVVGAELVRKWLDSGEKLDRMVKGLEIV